MPTFTESSGAAASLEPPGLPAPVDEWEQLIAYAQGRLDEVSPELLAQIEALHEAAVRRHVVGPFGKC